MRWEYDDIINLEYPYPTEREKMSLDERAAQFSPFAALTGYERVIKEESRDVERKIQISEEEKEAINKSLNKWREDLSAELEVTYFIPDKVKDGGEYITKRTKVKKIDEEKKILFLSCGENISFDDIKEIR